MKYLKNYIRDIIIESMGANPVRKKFDIPIPEDLKKIHQRIKHAGRELFLVGGAVRDSIMGKNPKDYDVATNASPEEVIKILQRDSSLRLDLTGKQFGVVRVKTQDGGEYEIATFREDIGKGKNTSVKFSSIENDVKRRDLTINALFFDMDSKEIVDYVGGIEDIEKGIIRAVGNPAQRFDEDRIRILRAIRFAGRMGSDLDPETKQAIIDDNRLIDTETGAVIPADRTTEEFVKGLKSAVDVNAFLSMNEELGLFDQLLPGLDVRIASASTDDHVAQLAAMLTSNPPGKVSKTLKKMRYSNDEIKTINFLISFLGLDRNSAADLKKSFNRQNIDVNHLRNFALVANVPDSRVDGFLDFAEAPPAGNPRDLIAQGLKGPEIGQAMAAAESESYEKFVREVRKYVRSVLREDLKESRFKQMSKSKFTGLKAHLANASFLDEDASGDYDGEYDELSSDAQQQLIVDLSDYLDEHFGIGQISVTVKVNTIPTLPEEGYNKALHGATYYYDGLHNIELLLASMEDGQTLRELGDAAQKIYEVVLHELLHMQQFLKFSRGKPSMESWESFKKKYEDRGGAEGMEGDYFFFDDVDGPSELETFSLQMATELVNSLGKSKAVSLLQKQNPDYELIRTHSASFRDIERKSPGALSRPEMRDMIKRAKQYAKRA